MGFKLNGSDILTSDGKTVGRYKKGSIALNFEVTGEPEQLLKFIIAVAEAYECIHPISDSVDIVFDDCDSDTTWSGTQLLLERTIKMNGNVIRVHKSDPDNWLSDLHGHILNRPGQKVDAYNGHIYCIKSRQKIGSLGKKDLAHLHNQLKKSDWAAAKLENPG